MTDSPGFEPRALREAMIRSLPWDPSSHEAPEPRFVYVPAKHARALHFDATLVVGIRGAGKSVWFNALRSAEHLKVLTRSLEQMGSRVDPHEHTHASPGFGSQPAIDEYPDKDTLKAVARAVGDPRLVWRAVMAWQTWGKSGGLPAGWIARATWISQHPQEAAAKFQTYDGDLMAAARRHLVLFDALDRAGDDWEERRGLFRGLLQTLLDFRGYKAIRAKAFVRPDMIDEDVSAFADASKILTTKVDLGWDAKDLFGLLWQHLGNDDCFGAQFRTASSPDSWTRVDVAGHSAFIPPFRLRFNQDEQRIVFHRIAGSRMGNGKNRGNPYVWLPKHLADALRQVSPRSFLSALRAAAEESTEHADHPYALSARCLNTGVRKASAVRVEEVREDHPWVNDVLAPLRGLIIPCEFSRIEERWEESDVLGKLKQSPQHLPKHLSDGHRGLREDLESLGFLETMIDKRINVPEVYRVGFGLKRRGGTKPVA